MGEARVKGDMFQTIFNQVTRKWGKDGLNTLKLRPDKFKTEQWYDFSEFCQLLTGIKSTLGNNNPLTIYQLGFKTMKEDHRWQGLFEKMNPEDVFLSTSRQEGQYIVGDLKAVPLGPKHVRVDFITGETEQLWFEFYRGRLQGVLELTGRTGVVHLLPAGESKDMRSYDIKWG